VKRDTKGDEEPNHKYMLVYVDDVLHIAENPYEDMDKLGSYRPELDVTPTLDDELTNRYQQSITLG